MEDYFALLGFSDPSWCCLVLVRPGFDPRSPVVEPRGKEDGVRRHRSLSRIWFIVLTGFNSARRVIVNKIGEDSTNQKWRWDQVRECFRDPQVYFGFANTFLACIPNG